MARPIRETPILKGEDAFNFEMRRLKVENMSKEQRAENLRKLREDVAKFRLNGVGKSMRLVPLTLDYELTEFNNSVVILLSRLVALPYLKIIAV